MATLSFNVKDEEAREQLQALEEYVESLDQPWTPLEDGYSNFWFELTDDTLSPWLNFSAKNNDAVIDWGDGSGEVALDTLTPTHTYSKAGKYVVKVKGVTGIAQQNTAPYNGSYLVILKNVELNSEVLSLSNYAFLYSTMLEHIYIHNNNVTIGNSAFRACSALVTFDVPKNITSISDGMMHYCFSIASITIPSGVTTIGNNAFNFCVALKEIHLKPTTPPTLQGNYTFSNISSDFIIYVPVGYGETYKAASGWSAYADHIVEEGQSLSKSQLRAIAEEQKKSDNGEEMR